MERFFELRRRGRVTPDFMSSRQGEAPRGFPKPHTFLEEFFLQVGILPRDSLAARQCGELRASPAQEERPMGNQDMMIAAHALARGLIVVTSDRAFGKIRKLKLEDWTKNEG